MQGYDKRRYLRAPIRVNFYVDDRNSGEIGELFFLSKNVSLGGAFLASEFLLERGSTVTVRFQLPGLGKTIEASACIAWVSEEDAAEPGMGVEFVEISDGNQKAIQRFIEQTLTATGG